MDIELIRIKQDSIARCIGRIRTKSDLSLEALLDDYDAQDVITLNLERAIQQACDIGLILLSDANEPVPGTMRETFAALRRCGVLTTETADHMMKAVGFRNTAVHAYQQIDWGIVYSIINERLPDFSDFVREIDSSLDAALNSE